MTMRASLVALATLVGFCGLLAYAPKADAQVTSTVVTTCGTAGPYTAGGTRQYPTMDVNGSACDNAGGLTPTGGVQIGTKQSGTANTAVIGCDTHAFYDASDNGKKTVVAGVSAKKIYVCGYILATGGTATNLSLTSGTGSDCVTTSTAITPAFQLVANDRVGANSAFWNGLITLANADNLCVNASAGNAHQVEIWYTVQ